MTDQLHIVVDTREQTPLTFGPDVSTTTVTLQSGDYSVRGLESRAVIERKSLPDLVSCVGPERDRFTRELQRLRAYPCRALVLECSLSDITEHRYRSKTAPAAVLGSLTAWSTRYGIPVWFCGNADGAAHITERVFRHYRDDLRTLLRSIIESDATTPAVPAETKRKTT